MFYLLIMLFNICCLLLQSTGLKTNASPATVFPAAMSPKASPKASAAKKAKAKASPPIVAKALAAKKRRELGEDSPPLAEGEDEEESEGEAEGMADDTAEAQHFLTRFPN
jgi:hypothetical protein